MLSLQTGSSLSSVWFRRHAARAADYSQLWLGLGANIAGLFMGAVCYADDVLLIAPTRNSMQRMLIELEEFAAESNITFSTDQTEQVSPWVSQADHLGNTLTASRGTCSRMLHQEGQVHQFSSPNKRGLQVCYCGRGG